MKNTIEEMSKDLEIHILDVDKLDYAELHALVKKLDTLTGSVRRLQRATDIELIRREIQRST